MTLELSDANPSASRALARGEELVLRLAENPTTGYRWRVRQSGSGSLGVVEERYVAGGPTPGAAGHRLVRFVARTPGDVTLEATLGREWDPPGASLAQRVFALSVSG